jgi:hypothetical protein
MSSRGSCRRLATQSAQSSPLACVAEHGLVAPFWVCWNVTRNRNGTLMITGVTEEVTEQLTRTETTDRIPEEDVFLAGDTLGTSTEKARASASTWQEETTRETNT